MSLETGLALAGGLMLLLAFVVQVLPSASTTDRRRVIVPAARAAAAGLLIASLLPGITTGGNWISPDLHQLALGLALATLLMQAIYSWRVGTGFAGPVSDVACLALVLLAVGVLPHTQPLGCLRQSAALYAKWILYLLGAGGAVAAGSAALKLALRARLGGGGESVQPPLRIAAQTYLQRGTELTLILLSTGLVCDAWLASQEVGRLLGNDPRQVWMAIASLLAATSLLAWRIERRGTRRAEVWAAALALLTAFAATFGLLVASGIGLPIGV